MVSYLRNVIVTICLALGLAGAAVAQDTPILTVVVGDESTQLDLADLAALPQTSFTTSTIWTEGPQNFTGVSLSDLVAALELTGDRLQAFAINDYSVEVPMEDAVTDGPIVAYLNNGDPMSVRDKGPLWLVYPYDTNPAYKSEVIYSRSIWQLTKLEVKD